jgi:hypothetical protein
VGFYFFLFEQGKFFMTRSLADCVEMVFELV